MKIRFLFYAVLFFTLLISNSSFGNLAIDPPKKGLTTSLRESSKTTHFVADIAPEITAEGNQAYCPLANTNIVTSVSITDTDPGDTGTEAVYIQISSGYIKSQDKLFLNNASLHPTIKDYWEPIEGKLTLKSPIPGTKVTYEQFENAIKDIQFHNSSLTPTGTRKFSISIGSANYLPSNGHYYEYVSALGTSWTSARAAAELKTYYGLKGYLATLTTLDEALFAGEQSQGTGWIGGSDDETEGVWKWVTGPEAGTIFWRGLSNGSTPNFAYWNNGEPNQAGEENYAHITAPGIGKTGSWNDLTNAGNPSGDYQAKGYIVEYGGTPGDPILHLSATTALTIAAITSTKPGSRCDAGTVTLEATASAGTINWYDSATAISPRETGPSFTTPNITTTTTYYVEAANCTNNRTPVEAKINITPGSPNANSPVTNCGPGTFTLTATLPAATPEETINWYSQIDGPIIGNGLSYTTPTISENTTYYAEAINNGCAQTNKTSVDLTVYPLPAVTDETVGKCSSGTVTLDAAIPDMSYSWSTTETSQTIEVSTEGIYTVDVTSPLPENCTNRKTITVIDNAEPEIKNIIVDQTTVSIELVKTEDYFEYSIDGNNFQSSNVFTNTPTGLQTAYVRDTKRCSNDTETFIVFVVPKFFTPNNDTKNDFWKVKGLADYPLGEVTIFDRYGKIITHLNHINPSWDGTLNKKPLPASDYWYVLKLEPNSPEVRGHFTLKR